MNQAVKEIARGYIQTFRTVSRLLRFRQMAFHKLAGIPINLLAYLLNRPPPLPPPILQLDITNMCNLHCPGCLTGMGYNKGNQGMMSYDDFKSMIDRVARYTALAVLYNSGEPLLHPRAVEMIHHLNRNRIASVISTNGHFIKTRLEAELLVTSGLSVMVVSLSGTSQKTYGHYHRGGNLDQVIRGVRYVRDARKKLRKRTPIIILRFLIMEHNIHEKKAMAELAENTGSDWHEFRTVNWQACLTEKPSAARDDKNRQPDQNATRRCLWPWLISVLDWNGDVYPCCFFRLKLPLMGNAFDADGIRVIWKNKAYNHFRRIMRSGKNCPPACLGCPAETGFQTRFSRQKRTIFLCPENNAENKT